MALITDDDDGFPFRLQSVDIVNRSVEIYF